MEYKWKKFKIVFFLSKKFKIVLWIENIIIIIWRLITSWKEHWLVLEIWVIIRESSLVSPAAGQVQVDLLKKFNMRVKVRVKSILNRVCTDNQIWVANTCKIKKKIVKKKQKFVKKI